MHLDIWRSYFLQWTPFGNLGDEINDDVGLIGEGEEVDRNTGLADIEKGGQGAKVAGVQIGEKVSQETGADQDGDDTFKQLIRNIDKNKHRSQGEQEEYEQLSC